MADASRSIFSPFRGLRYAQPDAAVTAPPYDVIDADEAAELRARDAHNIVNLDLPVDVGDAGTGAAAADPQAAVEAAHASAAELLTQWVDEGVFTIEAEPAFYLYRQGYRDSDGGQHQTAGIVGSLAIDSDRVLPHERTTPKAASDRRVSLEKTQTNLSMIYAMSSATGLSDLLEPQGQPVAQVTDDEGVRHRLWRITSPARLRAITDVIGSAPVVIADGHHRYTVARQYLHEADSTPDAASRIMTFVVPLDPQFLEVRPIHRVLPELGHSSELRERLEEIAEVTSHPDIGDLGELGPDDRAVVVVGPDGAWSCKPRLRDADRETLDRVPEALRPLLVVWTHEVLLPHLGADSSVFHHSADEVARRVDAGEAAAGVLLPAISVDDIRRVADADQRMPPKTTFFWPKARTGLVLRRFTDQ